MLKNIRHALTYIEESLTNGAFCQAKVSVLACTSFDNFQRLFSYMAGISLNEYVRRRKFSLAAQDLLHTKERVIDLAVKYGYNSADAFSRAFRKQQGVSPAEARRQGVLLNFYPPISFHITVKGVKGMKMRIVQKQARAVKGISRKFAGAAGDRWEQEHIMWADEEDNIRSQVSETVPGVWFGVWDNGVYGIARRPEDDCKENLQDFTIPGGQYAVFESSYGKFVGDVLPDLREQVFNGWIAESGYETISDYEVEVYYLYGQTEKEKRHYELWIPVKEKKFS